MNTSEIVPITTHFNKLFYEKVADYAQMLQTQLNDDEITNMLLNEGFSRDSVNQFLQDKQKREIEAMRHRIMLPGGGLALSTPSARNWFHV